MASMMPLRNGKSRVSWYDGNGVRHRQTLDKKPAQLLYDSICAQKIFEITGVGSAHQIKSDSARRMTFADLACRYRDEHLLPFTRAKSNKYYVEVLVKKWGENRIGMVDVQAFKKWIRHALSNPIPTPIRGDWKLTQLAASSVKKLVRYMTRIHYWGVQEGLINSNPFANVISRKDLLQKEFRRHSTFRPVVLSAEEFWGLVDTFPAYVRNPAIGCFFTGGRRSEIITIRWSQVNRKQHRLEFSADEVKEADEKVVYYDQEFETVLEALEIDRLTNGFQDDAVFRNQSGAPLSSDSFSHSLRLYCDKYAEKPGNEKFRKVTPHTFRRSYRTRKDQEGADRKAVRFNMGHHSDATSDIYNVVDDERQRSVAGFTARNDQEVQAKVEEMLDAARSKGITLSEIQSAIRQQWKLTEKKEPDAR